MTGETFYIDRDTGEVWCDFCVPAEIALLFGGRDQPRDQARYMEVWSGALRVAGPVRTCRVRARCHVCGAVQPPKAAAA